MNVSNISTNNYFKFLKNIFQKMSIFFQLYKNIIIVNNCQVKSF